MRQSEVKGLPKILGPVTSDDFFRQYWELQPLHISRNDNEYFADVLTLAQIETLLSTQELRFPSVQLSHRKNPIASAEYTDASDQILPLRLIEYHHEGATIVISQAHKRLSALAQLKRQIQQELQLRCQTNLYLSPPENQGFNAHYDSHDVFILQVQGSKTFNFYGGGVELPYNHEAFEPGRHVPGALEESIPVEPGDTLYIPRGVMHDAVANDTTSLHITLGVYAMTQRDVLLEMVEVLTDQDTSYRQSILPRLQSETDSLLDLQFNPLQLQNAIGRLIDDVAVSGMQDCSGRLMALESGTTLSLDSTIGIRDQQILQTERQGNTLSCRSAGVVLEFTDPMGRAIEQLQSTSSLPLRQLQGLSDEQKIALCVRLQQANLITVL